MFSQAADVAISFKTRQDKTRQCFIWSLIQSYVHRLYPNNLKLSYSIIVINIDTQNIFYYVNQRKGKSNGDLLFKTLFNLSDFTKLISSYDICYYFSESPSTISENHSNFPAAFALVEKAKKPGSSMTLMGGF